MYGENTWIYDWNRFRKHDFSGAQGFYFVISVSVKKILYGVWLHSKLIACERGQGEVTLQNGTRTPIFRSKMQWK